MAASGTSLALGSFLDGVPEQAVLGIGLAGGEPVSVALLVAIFVSNLPEGIGAGIDMQAAGMARGKIFRMFLVVAVVCTLSSGVGFAIADSVSGDFQAAINGFAAGALLVMLIDSMIPEAREKGAPAGRPRRGSGLCRRQPRCRVSRSPQARLRPPNHPFWMMQADPGFLRVAP